MPNTATQVPASSISDEEIAETHDVLLPQLDKLRRYMAVRASISSLVESLLLLDRYIHICMF